MRRYYQISYASIALDGEFGTDADSMHSALHRSWFAGADTERYGREWRLEHWDEDFLSSEGLWFGRIGYVHRGKVTTLEWAEQPKRFRRGHAGSGVVVPFLIDPATSLVTFQLIPGEVKPQTFAGNLQALLAQQPTHKWMIRPVTDAADFATWRRRVRHVTDFSVRVDLPNPDWTGREMLGGLVTGLNTERLSFSGAAPEKGSIDTDSEWWEQLLLHALKEYGKAAVVGRERGTNAVMRWESGRKAGTPIVRWVDAGDGPVEAPREVLDGNRGDDEIVSLAVTAFQ